MSRGVRTSRSNRGQCSSPSTSVVVDPTTAARDFERGRIGPMGFTRAELESYVDSTVPDLVGPGLVLLFVGINPGLWTAATGTHFAHPGNRFYPALLAAGIIERPIDRGIGMTVDDRRICSNAGSASPTSSIAPRPRRRSSRRRSCAPAGNTSGRSFDARPACRGRRRHHCVPDCVRAAERERWGSNRIHSKVPRLFVVPNPSGLNAHETIATIAAAYREPALAAGVVRP